MGVLRFLPLTALLGSCDVVRPAAPLPAIVDQVGVFAVLQAGVPRAAVTVVRFRGDMQPFEVGWEAVPGSTVEILEGAATHRLTLDASTDACIVLSTAQSVPQGTCYTGTLPNGVQPGAHYGLRVTLPDGGRVEGDTRVPGTPDLLSPASSAGITVTGDAGSAGGAFTARWRVAQGTGRLELGIRSERRECVIPLDPRDPTGNRVVLPQSRDSSALRIRDVQCSLQGRLLEWDSIPVTVQLTSYDSAYARYAESIGALAVGRSQAAAGLRGAVGVFAGSATVERRVSVTRRK